MNMKKWGLLGLIYLLITLSFFGWYMVARSLNIIPIPVAQREVLVTQYINEHINELTPEEPVLGGTWYVTEIAFDNSRLTGLAIYEDGHIQNELRFDVQGLGKNFKVNSQYINLGVGELGKFNGLKIRFNELVQDNRCPINANCIEAGAVTVNITLMDNDGYGTTGTLNRASDEVPMEWGHRKISIVKVEPPVILGQEINPQDYRVTFKVE